MAVLLLVGAAPWYCSGKTAPNALAAPAADGSAAAPAPAPQWNRTNVLILAVDATDVKTDAPGATTTVAASPRAAALPKLGAADTQAPITSVNAKRKPRPEDDEAEFRREPDRDGTLAGEAKTAATNGQKTAPGITPAGATGAPGNATPAGTTTGATGTAVPAGSTGAATATGAARAVSEGSHGGSPFAPVDDRQPSRSLSAAAPLRRALLRSGCTDVTNTTADGPPVMRAVQSRRLTSRVVEMVQTAALKTLQPARGTVTPAAGGAAGAGAAPAGGAALAGGDAGLVDDAATEARNQAIQAGSRIGQALGYRAVVIYTVTSPAASTPLVTAQPAADATANVQYAMLIVDAAHETGAVSRFSARGADEFAANETAAGRAATVVADTVTGWQPLTYTERETLINDHLGRARGMLAKGDNPAALDEVNQVLGLDAKRGEALIMLGELLQASNPTAAADALRKAVELNNGDGPTWGKLAIAHTIGAYPDWPRALEAARRALALGYDSAALRTAMATAQFGRADLFRKADRIENAEEAELDAKRHLDRALELEPDDPAVARLIANRLVSQNRFKEAVQALDRLALQYPKDAEIQTQYALALTGLGTRDEDAFVVWTRVWKMTGVGEVNMEPARYRHIAEGFDQRLSNIGKSAGQLSFGVSTGALPRESALLQLTRLKEDMQTALAAIRLIQPSDRVSTRAHSYRVFAADLMDQALQAHQVYLETGQDVYRGRALEMHRQSIEQLNTARTSSG